MGHDDECHEPYTIPDYTIYKVEDIPLLVLTQKALEAQGLSDPWLRNEVWRYTPCYFGTARSRTIRTFFTGFKTGVVLTAVTLIGTFAFDRIYPEKHEPAATKEEKAINVLEEQNTVAETASAGKKKC